MPPQVLVLVARPCSDPIAVLKQLEENLAGEDHICELRSRIRRLGLPIRHLRDAPR